MERDIGGYGFKLRQFVCLRGVSAKRRGHNGNLKTSTCGVAGYFVGTLQANMLIGSIKMQRCTGGNVSGTVSGSQLSLLVGDLLEPLVTDQPVMTGGIVTLQR